MIHYKVVFNYAGFPAEMEADLITDILSQLLADIGFESFEYKETGCIGYIQNEFYNSESIDNLVQEFPLDSITITYQSERLPSVDWNEEWESKHFKPVEINNRCVIMSPDHKIEKAYEYRILINPKMAFGTGTHDTTALIVNFLFDQDMKGKKVLDMGCGTGVLGIAAALLGAEKIDAIDIDQSAVDNTKLNMKLNHVQNYCATKGDASNINKVAEYDFILANIMRNILVNDMQDYYDAMKEGAKLVMSGFYHDDASIVREKAESLNMKIVQEKVSENGWTMLVAVK